MPAKSESPLSSCTKSPYSFQDSMVGINAFTAFSTDSDQQTSAPRSRHRSDDEGETTGGGGDRISRVHHPRLSKLHGEPEIQ